MTWFWFSLLALLFWSGSDLFSKVGCRDQKDPLSHLKMVIAVGAVMGIHAFGEIFLGGVSITWHIILTYLPVALLYILSMAVGYFGLRYIELSISSPICNASGAVVAVLAIFTAGTSYPPAVYAAIVLVCAGVLGLGVVEAREDEELRAARQSRSNYRYVKSWLALALPILYCILDAAGTFLDNLVLDKLSLTVADYEASANVAYELTFLAAGFICAVYVYLIRKEKPAVRQGSFRCVGAVFETVGQFFYIFAVADTEHLAMSAPIISAYCMASVLWSRIFLRERLSKWHYAMILLVAVGIVLMGVFDV